jgi:DNA invertase Pin-like site-specific DNA recombinase
MITKRFFAYARVSTDSQQNGLESQVRALKEYCRMKGIEDFIIFQDENQSGTKSSRPALDQMMKAVRAGECQGVIVYSFSRYARSVTHLLRALEEFKALGVRFVSMTESIDTDTPLGVALFTILGAVAQLERDLIAERVRNGLANAKAKGIRIGRKKLRPSELIRTLRRSGCRYREIANITRMSQGAISTELAEWRKELAEGGRTIADEMAAHRMEHQARTPGAIKTEGEVTEGIEINRDAPIQLELVR